MSDNGVVDHDAVAVPAATATAASTNDNEAIDIDDDEKSISELKNKLMWVSEHNFRGEFSPLYGKIFLSYDRQEDVKHSKKATGAYCMICDNDTLPYDTDKNPHCISKHCKKFHQSLCDRLKLKVDEKLTKDTMAHRGVSKTKQASIISYKSNNGGASLLKLAD
jgi:hypothetical protein